jgi:hypothetical protein
MVKRFSFLLVFLAACPLLAGQATQKYDWNPVQGAQDVHVEVERVVVSSLQFDLGSQVPPTHYSTAKVVARVDNNGFLKYEVGVAVVVFDADGNIVAAGSAAEARPPEKASATRSRSSSRRLPQLRQGEDLHGHAGNPGERASPRPSDSGRAEQATRASSLSEPEGQRRIY